MVKKDYFLIGSMMGDIVEAFGDGMNDAESMLGNFVKNVMSGSVEEEMEAYLSNDDYAIPYRVVVDKERCIEVTVEIEDFYNSDFIPDYAKVDDLKESLKEAFETALFNTVMEGCHEADVA